MRLGLVSKRRSCDMSNVWDWSLDSAEVYFGSGVQQDSVHLEDRLHQGKPLGKKMMKNLYRISYIFYLIFSNVIWETMPIFFSI